MARSKAAKLKIHGDVQNAAFAVAIGQLIIAWSNNESLFLAILQALVHGSKANVNIIWRAQRNTRSRIQMVRALVAEQIEDDALIARLDDAIAHFKTLSRWRNFYCHAMYDYRDKKLLEANGSDDNFSTVTKPLNLGTLNEIQNTTELLHTFNIEMWRIVREIDARLGIKRDDKYPGLEPA